MSQLSWRWQGFTFRRFKVRYNDIIWAVFKYHWGIFLCLFWDVFLLVAWRQTCWLRFLPSWSVVLTLDIPASFNPLDSCFLLILLHFPTSCSCLVFFLLWSLLSVLVDVCQVGQLLAVSSVCLVTSLSLSRQLSCQHRFRVHSPHFLVAAAFVFQSSLLLSAALLQ